tara:strand:- start:26 stop:232 length:207 start_codon:yes stop_codon:yes gene_type:complete
MAKDGKHYPSKKFKDNFDEIFRPAHLTDADVEYIKEHTERVFSEQQHKEDKIKQMERDNEKCLEKNSK